ncbi:MAG: aspartate-semialdehyde dehydrogenase [Bacteroides sp.]|jgi:aspartate-semialdehyde dehydrogenase
MKIAVVGATGLVGSVMCTELDRLIDREFELLLAASQRSVGRRVSFRGRELLVQSIADVLAARPDIVLFAAGSTVSLEYAEQFAKKGTYVVDNSSAWRMHPEVPLVVPEINDSALRKEAHIIANPNCSTIQMVMALAPLCAFGLKRIHVSTYQSVSGSGMKGIEQLQAEREGREPERRAYPYPIDLNCIPHCDEFLENGYTKEEMKLVNETRKIFNLPQLAVSATAVRVPVWGGHSESVSVEFEKPIKPDEARNLIAAMHGVTVLDDPSQLRYPMARYAQESDQVFVGRIRQDLATGENGLTLWVVADNIRKGAATNAVQIVKALLAKGFCQ